MPFASKKAEEQERVDAYIDELRGALTQLGVRTHVDERTHLRPGAKYFEWERKGVPLRVDVGPRDLASGETKMARRVDGEKLKLELNVADVSVAAQAIAAELTAIQERLLATARARVAARTFELDSYGEMASRLAGTPMLRGALAGRGREKGGPGPYVGGLQGAMLTPSTALPPLAVQATRTMGRRLASSSYLGRTARRTRPKSRRRPRPPSAASPLNTRERRPGGSASSRVSRPPTWLSSHEHIDMRPPRPGQSPSPKARLAGGTGRRPSTCGTPCRCMVDYESSHATALLSEA